MKSVNELPLISVSGTDYERGFQIGRTLGDKIGLNIGFYMNMWAETGSTMDEVTGLASRFAPAVKSYAPHIFQEIEGIAAGCGRPVEELVALNCRWELFYVNAIKNECTSIGLNSENNSEKHTILAQNWDYMAGVREGCALIFEKQEPERPNLLMHTEAGVVGQKGMNSENMGMVVNGLASYDDKFDVSTPFLVMLREVLNQRSIEMAKTVVGKTSRSVSGNLMVAQSGKGVMDIECTSDAHSVISESKGRLNHANTFCSLEFRDSVRDKIRDVYPDSEMRQERSSILLDSHKSDSSGVEKVKSILSDHENSPNSICRHTSEQPAEEPEAITLASMIMDLDDLVLLIANGNPCMEPYQKIDARKYWS